MSPNVGERTMLVGALVLAPSGPIEADLVIEGGLVSAIEPKGSARSGTVVDATGVMAIPGLIDLQTNGGFGYDFTSSPESIWDVGARLPATGVTAFLPTIITSPSSSITAAREVMAAGPPSGYSGAVPLGLHLEGPMLSPQHRGTHDARHLQRPRLELVDGWSPKGYVRMVTIAPELDGARPVIGALAGRGVIVSLGHSGATYLETVSAIDNGACLGTHLYNAMPVFDHREPGLVGALLSEESVSLSVIVDGIHVHAASVAVAWNAKKPDGFVLVTDSMAALGMGQGTFDLGGVRVTVGDDGPRNPFGGLAGSTLSLDQAVRNLILFTDCSQRESIAAATENPARLLQDPTRGSIVVGGRADVVLVDGALDVKATLVGGELVFADPVFEAEREIRAACHR